MYDTVECPYCRHDNDMSNALVDGLSDDNTLDWTCDKCEEEFEVYVEFYPTYYPSKIEYLKCEMCGKNTRDFKRKGMIYPFPENLDIEIICKECWAKGIFEDMERYKNK